MRLIKIMLLSFVESLIRNISGSLGLYIRFFYYSKRLKSCGKNIRIEEGVFIHNPENMCFGNNIHIMAYSIITAKKKDLIYNNRIVKNIENHFYQFDKGSLIIDDEVSIGAYNIIQAYGGIHIKKRVTTSARVSLYSYSHYPLDESRPSVITYANPMVDSENISCIESPIVIGEAVWLGLNVSVFGGSIGNYTFVATNSVVIKGLPENSYASGNPAIFIKNRFEI